MIPYPTLTVHHTKFEKVKVKDKGREKLCITNGIVTKGVGGGAYVYVCVCVCVCVCVEIGGIFKNIRT